MRSLQPSSEIFFAAEKLYIFPDMNFLPDIGKVLFLKSLQETRAARYGMGCD